MSRSVLEYTSLAPLRRIASRIITEQTKSIQDMEEALCACSTLENAQSCREGYLQRVQEITRTMFTCMGTACATNQIDANFMREMIPHHKGAIRMSENALRFPICPGASTLYRPSLHPSARRAGDGVPAAPRLRADFSGSSKNSRKFRRAGACPRRKLAKGFSPYFGRSRV